MIPIILSGGSGTRLWPLSRSMYPKQFLPLYSNKTLLQETITRLDALSVDAPIVVCNESHRFIVDDNMQSIGIKPQNIILEPVGRNTAPAIAVAALIALNSNDDPILLVLPADHVIKDVEAFHNAVNVAEKLASKGKLVTFGVKPDSAHTGYGYIEAGEEIEPNVNAISSFIEKPTKEVAENFISKDNFLWNSGMFCFKASEYIKELKTYQPKLLEHVQQTIRGAHNDLNFSRLSVESFEKCEDIAIDYAVMEYTKNGVVVKLDAEWSDIGSWDSVWDQSQKDDNENVCKGDVITHECKRNYIYSKDKLVSAIGIEDLIIVDTQDAILIANKNNVQHIKTVVSKLREENREEATNHKTVYRPWGNYTTISRGSRHLTKRISVKPGAKLSLQRHHHRSEHWIIVKGTAKITKGEETIILPENESVYIPIGTKHSLENPGKITLEIIEVQTGSYLEEDDIIRLEDIYGRE